MTGRGRRSAAIAAAFCVVGAGVAAPAAAAECGPGTVYDPGSDMCVVALPAQPAQPAQWEAPAPPVPPESPPISICPPIPFVPVCFPVN